MLHIRVVDCGLTLWVKQFELKCSNSVERVHKPLCTKSSTPKSCTNSKIGQENIHHNRTGEWPRE